MTKESPAGESRSFAKVYGRYCRQLDKEDKLIDQRLTWLLASQSILFGAIGLSNPRVAEITLAVVPLVGIGTAVLIGASVRAAQTSFQNYRNTLLTVCSPEEDKERAFPQLHRNPTNIRLGFLTIALPGVFLAAWILVVVLNASGRPAHSATLAPPNDVPQQLTNTQR